MLATLSVGVTYRQFVGNTLIKKKETSCWEHADKKKETTPPIFIEKKPLQIQRGEPFYR